MTQVTKQYFNFIVNCSTPAPTIVTLKIHIRLKCGHFQIFTTTTIVKSPFLCAKNKFVKVHVDYLKHKNHVDLLLNYYYYLLGSWTTLNQIGKD